MAHADYNCCAICDCKLDYNAGDARTKEDLCKGCISELVEKGIKCFDAAQFLNWSSSQSFETLREVLIDLCCYRCYYPNPFDDAMMARGILFDPDTRRAVKELIVKPPVEEEVVAPPAVISLEDHKAKLTLRCQEAYDKGVIAGTNRERKRFVDAIEKHKTVNGWAIDVVRVDEIYKELDLPLFPPLSVEEFNKLDPDKVMVQYENGTRMTATEAMTGKRNGEPENKFNCEPEICKGDSRDPCEWCSWDIQRKKELNL